MNEPSRILVVDDDPAILRVFSTLMRTAGHEVRTASTGRQALQQARKHPPDLVLLDVVLPDVSGIEVCRQVKADRDLLDVFVVLFSGVATGVAHKVTGLKTGADDYITRPVDPEEFLTRLRTLLRLKHTTTALRTSEQRYQSLAESAPDAIVILDRKGRIQYVNPTGMQWLGRSEPELLGRSSQAKFFPPDIARRHRELLKRAFERGEMVRQEAWMPLPSGKKWIEMRGVPLRDRLGAVTSVMGIARDLTEQKQREDSLRTDAIILESMAEGVIVTDEEGKVVLMNPAAEQLSGYRREEIIGRPVDMLSALPQSKAAEQLLRVLDELETTGRWRGTFENLRRDGSTYLSEAIISTFLIGGRQFMVSVQQDVTERMRAEDALRSQESRIRLALESARMVTWVYESRTGLIRYSDNLGAFIGSPTIEPYCSMAAALHQIHPEDREGVKEAMRRACEENCVFEREYRVRMPDGCYRWILGKGRAALEQAGTTSRILGVSLDITERKWTENLLQVQRDFAMFLESAHDLNATVKRLLTLAVQSEGIDCGGVYLVDPKTAALNLAAHQGLSAAFIKHVTCFVPGPAQARRLKTGKLNFWREGKPMTGMTRQLKREGLLTVEAIPILESGRLLAVLNVGSHAFEKIPPQSRRRVEAIATQVSGALARIRIEESLQASHQLLEKIFQNVSSAVFVVDDGTLAIQECNPAATRIFGYTREEMIGRSMDRLHVDQVWFEKFKVHLHAAIKTKGFLSDFEFRMKRKNGTMFPSEHSVTPIRDESGRIVSWTGVIRDITQRKRNETELQNLPRLIIEAQEEERSRVARELHDGVNQLIGSAKMRLHNVQDSLPAIRPAAREILSRCSNLLVQALEENRRIAHNLRPSDLDELGLAAACRNFCRQFQARNGLTVICSIARPSLRLSQTVELNLFRIVQEALNNVEKHARAKTVRVQLSFQRDLIVLRIKDDGRGLPAKGSKPAKQRRQGVGLTHMRERAISLGGSCGIESASNRGTTVIVRIPRRNPSLTRI